jgi:hypothetical protein
MELAHRWLDRNLTRLELAVACTILLLLLGFFMRYMLVFFARTEKIMVETSIVNLNSALKYRAAIAMMRGDKTFISSAIEQSPFGLVSDAQGTQILPALSESEPLNLRVAAYTTLPSRYLGELDNPDPATVEAGFWYFDRSDRTLNYIVRNDEFFRSDLGEVPWIKLRVTVDYNDRDGNGRYDPDIDEYQSIQLKSIGNYSWAE